MTFFHLLSIFKGDHVSGETMGTARNALAVKPICALTFRAEVDAERVKSDLERLLGEVDDQSPVFAFDFTRYYLEEMDQGLQKTFFSFARLMSPETLPELKLKTNAVEEDWADKGKRRINVDPGYVTGGKLVLASTKDYCHRVYIGQGIYADVQLRFIHGRFESSEWTYPDYRTDLASAFFKKARDRLVKQEREHERTHPI